MANLRGLARATALETGYTISATEEIIRAFWDKVEEALENGDEVAIAKFGKFRCVERKEKKVYCPTNGNLIPIKSRVGVRFCESKALKARLNE